MLPADIIAELDDHGFADTNSTRKMGVLNDTIADVCSREPWPFLEKEATLTFDGISPSPTNVPADLSKVLGMQDGSLGVPIVWERWEIIKKKFSSQITTTGLGNPEYYYFVKGSPRIYPIPAATETVSLEYICFPTPILESDPESAILLPPRHHRVLTLGSLYKLYALEDDAELGQVFENEYEKRINMMREDLIRVQYDTSDRIFVVDPDDYDSSPWSFMV